MIRETNRSYKERRGKIMEIPMLRNRPDLLEPGNYRVKVGDCCIMDGMFGREVVMRFDLLDEGFAGRCVKA